MMFEVGDLVFAKLKGHRHPHWPAVVIEAFKLEHQSLNVKSSHSLTAKSKTGTPILSDKKLNKNTLLWEKSKVKVEAACDMFNVKFFGTNQTGIVTAHSVVLYNDESVERFNTAKNRKHRFFKDALAEIAQMKSKHLSRITRSSVKNMVNRKPDTTLFLLKAQKSLKKEVGQDKKQLKTDEMDIQQSSIPQLDKRSISDHLILPQKNFQIVNLPSAPANLQTKHHQDHPKRPDFLSSIPTDILLSSPTKVPVHDPVQIPVANDFNDQDMTVSSPVANHLDQDCISGLDSVTNDQDISLSSRVVNHRNYQDVLISSPIVNHPNIQDFPISSPSSNRIYPSIPVVNHHNLQDISVSSPIKLHHNHQNLPSHTKMDNDNQHLPDTCVSGSTAQVNPPLVLVLSRTPHGHQQQLKSRPVVDDEAFLPPAVLSSSSHYDLPPAVLSSSPSHHHLNSPSCSSFPAVDDEVCSHPTAQSLKHSYDYNDQAYSHLIVQSPKHSFNDYNDQVYSHPIVQSSKHSSDYNNEQEPNSPRICSSIPVVNDQIHLELSMSPNYHHLQSKLIFEAPNGDDLKTSNDAKVLVHGDDHKTSKDTDVLVHGDDHKTSNDTEVLDDTKVLVHGDDHKISIDTKVLVHGDDHKISKDTEVLVHGDDHKTSNDTEVFDDTIVFVHGDDHKMSKDTEVQGIKSWEWSPICKKRKLTIGSYWKLGINTTSIQDNLDKSFSSWVEKNLDELWVEKNLDESWVEENLDESWVEKNLDESSVEENLDESWVEENLDESSVEENLDESCVEENLDESSVEENLDELWVEKNLDESSVEENLDESWEEKNLEQSFSREENPCELSWVEPSFPLDLTDCTPETCDDVNKLVLGQNNFNQLDESYDIKIEVLVSDPNISGSQEIEPRNSDLNILSEQKISSSDSRYFISNLLTGLIGYIIDAFFDDDFEAYCCDELFSVAHLEEHVKKFHRYSPANVTIKTCQW